jgi:hypothetical protein
MPSVTHISKAFLLAAAAASILGCSNEPSPSGGATSQSAAPKPSAAAPSAVAPAVSATAPAPVATAPEKVHDCPEGSTGEGSLNKPCEAKGNKRMMEVTWTGKIGDTGPSFRVTNTSKLPILYGKIVVYFYDKAGKQLEVTEGKARPVHSCSGNLFGGVMKPGEKAVITFSCVEKKHVPEGAAAIEGELQIVGFADATEKKSEFYWRNSDLVPDARPKGGLKK